MEADPRQGGAAHEQVEVLGDKVGVVGGAVGAGEDEPGGGVRQAGGEGVGDLASPVRGEVGGGARVKRDPAVSAPGLGFTFDDPVGRRRRADG